MSFRIAIAIVLAGIAISPASVAGQSAQRVAAFPTVPDIPFRKFTLPNGLTLLVHEDHKAPIAAVNVWYHVGSKNERVGKTGFAHLFEHLFFGGSENAPGIYLQQLEPLGATDLNGTTNNDRTNFFETVPVSALERVLFLESDRMGHLIGSVDSARLTLQRGVVQNEKRQGENEPYGRTEIVIAENTYPRGHPYSWSVIGSMDDLNAASLADVKEWFQTYYGPTNAVLVVAGDVNADSVHLQVLRYFGDIPAGPPITKQQEWIAKMQGEHRQIMQDRVPQARLNKVWNVPAYGTPDEVYLSMAMDILGHGNTSRLYKRLVYKDRIATDVDAAVDEREIASQAELSITAQQGGDLGTVERVQNEELRAFLASGPTAVELDREKTQRRADFIRGLERVGGFGGKSDILASGMVYAGDPTVYKKIQARIATATAADVLAAAKRWLSDGDYVLEVHPFPEYSTATTDVDRKKPPANENPPVARLPLPERATLSNGLKIVLLSRTGVPVVRIQTFMDGGFAADKPAHAGLANMTMQMLTQGTGSRTALGIQDELASLGADLWAATDVDVMSVGMYALKDKFVPALAVYADVLQNATFPQSDLDRSKTNTIASIKQEQVQPSSMAQRVLPTILYGSGNAYSQPFTGTGTEASVLAMTRSDLAQFRDLWFKPNHATTIVVGDISMADLKAKLEHAFASWKPGDVPTKNIAKVERTDRKNVYIIDRPGADQSTILAAELVAPKANAGEADFQLFNDAFGGAFGSRINMNLREDKHWSYGVGSFTRDARGQRVWAVYAPVETDKTKESLSEVVKELSGVVSDKPLTGEEIGLAKDRTIRTLAGRWETNRAVAYDLADIENYGLPANYYVTYAEAVRSATGAQVNAEAKKMIDPKKVVLVVIGDRAKIEAGIKELNLGDVVELNADGAPKSVTP